MADDGDNLDWLRELNGEDAETKLPPGWEQRRDEDGYTCYYDSNRDIETPHPPPSEDWVPDKAHAHCACKGDPYCTGWDHHAPRRRPLAEPPMLDYDTLIKEILPSDKRFAKLFPNDVERWTTARDHHTEDLLLDEYALFAYHMRSYESDPARAAFFKKLEEDILIESTSVYKERASAFVGADELGKFEYHYLDQDGGTKAMEAWSAHDWDQLHSFSLRAWQKYSAQAPPGYEPKNRHWYCQWKGIECSSRCPECPKPERPERQPQPATEVVSTVMTCVSSGAEESKTTEEAVPQAHFHPPVLPPVVVETEEVSKDFQQLLFERHVSLMF